MDLRSSTIDPTFELCEDCFWVANELARHREFRGFSQSWKNLNLLGEVLDASRRYHVEERPTTGEGIGNLIPIIAKEPCPSIL